MRIFNISVLIVCVVVGSLQGQHNLMPVPKNYTIGDQTFKVDKSFTLGVSGNPHTRIYPAVTRFLRRLDGRTGLFLPQGLIEANSETQQHALNVVVKRPGQVALEADESYQIVINETGIKLTSETDIGAIRGLETILQLLTSTSDGYFLPFCEINDSPRYQWRGLMMDVARHFQTMDVLKRNLDAMASVKMNVFHWHLTDDQGFRIASNKHPKLHELGSDGNYYTHAQIREIVQYADERGIRVVPEIDIPGHASAFLTAYPELGSKDMAYSIERNAGIFHPTLDPTNEKTYAILDDIFSEVTPLFPDLYFHIGGDENEGKHWDENENIQAFMKKNKLETNHDLQTYFNIRVHAMLKKYGKEVMGWEEIMTPEMPKSALIHSWKGVNEGLPAKQSLVNAVKSGRKAILSNGYYIDLMLPAAEHYLVDPMPSAVLTQEEQQRILGGEATMWSELVTPLSIDSRIWPRTAAIAERFWSPADVNDVDDMYRRLEVVSGRLEDFGITHIRNRDVILRNLSNHNDISSLKLLADVTEPMKIYTRNPMGTMYQSFSPYSLWADATAADAKDARAFAMLINSFVEDSNTTTLAQINEWLKLWQSNHEKVKTSVEDSPVSKDILALSEKLKQAATLGLEMTAILQSDRKVGKDWSQQAQNTLENASNQSGRTELMIIKPLNRLLDIVIDNNQAYNPIKK
jgi:hexosaminidase